MHRILVVALLSMTLVGAQAQAPEEVNVTLDEPTFLDGVLDGVESVGEGIGDAGKGVANGVGSAMGAIGDAVKSIVTATGVAARVIVGATASMGGALAGGLAVGATALVAGIGALSGSIGDGSIGALASIVGGLATGVLWIGGGVGHGTLHALGGLASGFLGYLDIVGALRPAVIPAPVYWSAAAAGGAATAGIGGWAGWEALRRWGLVAGIAGFSRIQDDAILDHPLRSEIFTTIRENPGIHASQLAREVDSGWGTVTHHLDKLTKASMVTTRRVNNQKCYFEQGGKVGRAEMEIASAVKGDTAGLIAQFVSHNPMTSQKQMAEAIGISPALASFHVKKLENLGVLEKVRRGKETLLSTSEALRKLMASEQNPLMAVQAKMTGGLEYGS